MAERVMPGSTSCGRDTCEAVCIHTRKIYDSCRDKDCIEDLRFYPLAEGQEVLDRAISMKGGKAQLLYTYINVEPMDFHQGYYTVDLRFYYRVTLNACTSCPRSVPVEGLCVFDKRVILFGGEGSAKTFSSQDSVDAMERAALELSDQPTAVVEAVDPMVLGVKLTDSCERRCCDCDVCDIPGCVCRCFDGDLTMGECGRRVYVTLGQFSMVRLERDSQLLMPVYSYCVPEKECRGAVGPKGGDDPCKLFQGIDFPVDRFFPPSESRPGTDFDAGKSCCGCH